MHVVHVFLIQLNTDSYKRQVHLDNLLLWIKCAMHLNSVRDRIVIMSTGIIMYTDILIRTRYKL
jgi:uncharacterized protein YeeX (DUF496 family)